MESPLAVWQAVGRCEMTYDSENGPAHRANLHNSHLCRVHFTFLGGLYVKSYYNEAAKGQSMLSAKFSKYSSAIMLLLSAD